MPGERGLAVCCAAQCSARQGTSVLVGTVLDMVLQAFVR